MASPALRPVASSGVGHHGEPPPSDPTPQEVAAFANRANPPTCIICMEVMYPSQDIFTQWCTHPFHKFCMSEWRYQANKRDDECPFRCELNQEARRRHLTLWHWIKYWWFVKSCFVNHWSFIIKWCEGKVVTTTMMMSNFFELWWQRTFESGKVDDSDDEWYF